MKLKLSLKGNELNAALAGELDEHSAADVRRKLDDALRDPDITRVVFDMRSVTFMDSLGIGVILGRCRRLIERGGSMNVINAQRSVEKVLRISGVYKLCNERSGR